mmetsp:Transcript_14676/g.40544  ORF Transcript_14676/g.40544 Transcript_14676/m.40544 type:complete len:228 (+) Transcript_14676:819-1502(+)
MGGLLFPLPRPSPVSPIFLSIAECIILTCECSRRRNRMVEYVWCNTCLPVCLPACLHEHLVQILLMVLLGTVEVRSILHSNHLGHGFAAHAQGPLGKTPLLLRMHEDGGTVLRAAPTRIGRRVELEEHVQELAVVHDVGIELNADGFCIIQDVLVGGIGSILRILGTAVSDHRRLHALDAIVITLRAPKSSHGDLEDRGGVRDGRQERADAVRGGRGVAVATVVEER